MSGREINRPEGGWGCLVIPLLVVGGGTWLIAGDRIGASCDRIYGAEAVPPVTWLVTVVCLAAAALLWRRNQLVALGLGCSGLLLAGLVIVTAFFAAAGCAFG